MSPMPDSYDYPIPLDPRTMQPIGVDQPQMQGLTPSNYSWQTRLGGAAKDFMGNRDLALALLANSGRSPYKKGFGEVLGTSMLQADQMKQGREDDAFKRKYMEAQIAAMTGKNSKPSSVQEYEYARQNGYTGSYQDWTVAGGQSSRPSPVVEWEFFNKLDPNQQQRYLEMKRNPNFTVQTIDQAKVGVQQLPGGAVRTTPLSTTASEAAAAGQVKGAESQASAIGTGLGNIQAGVQTKGSNAGTVIGMLDIADPLIDVATGSAGGAARDKVTSFFGEATDGSKAIAQLQVLQAGLMTNMPRMEGPQSDRDVELYRQAAGQIGDPTVPRDIKKAAVKTIRDIQKRYQERAGKTPVAEDPLGIR